MSAATIKQILLPVPQLDEAVEFYTSQLGFPVIFIDAPRYAALDAGPVTLALIAGLEDVTDGQVSFSVAVQDLDSTVAEMAKAGTPILRSPRDGPHERRAVIEAAGGHAVVLFTKL